MRTTRCENDWQILKKGNLENTRILSFCTTRTRKTFGYFLRI